MHRNPSYLSPVPDDRRATLRLPAATLVLTPNGPRPIGALRTGASLTLAEGGEARLVTHRVARSDAAWMRLPGTALDLLAAQEIAVFHPLADLFFAAPAVRVPARALGWRSVPQARFVPAVDIRLDREALLAVSGYSLVAPGDAPTNLPPLLDTEEAFWFMRKIGPYPGEDAQTDQSRSIAMAMP